jgi:choline dehydrogenase
MNSKHYDYILVGGGSAACAAASRLVEAGASVLVLERGPAKAGPIMHFAAGYMKFLARDTYLVMHRTEPQPQLGGRAPVVPQARVLGGGGAVNAMVYVRGQCEDYADWNRAVGGSGSGQWDWDDMLPHYVRQEDNDHLGAAAPGVRIIEGFPPGSHQRYEAGLAEDLAGHGGPLYSGLQ